MNAPHTLTPRQYIDARRLAIRTEYGCSVTETEQDYPDRDLMADWLRELWQAARRGETLTAIVLDRLFEYNETAFWQMYHDYDRTLLPAGYLNPKARHNDSGVYGSGGKVRRRQSQEQPS